MKLQKKILAVGLLAFALPLAGCGVLSAIGAWLPFGISVVDGVVAVVAPSNTVIAQKGQASITLFNAVSAAVTAAQAAGAGQTGLPKVISELSSASQSQQGILNDLSAVGANIPAKDLNYATAAESLVITALQGFETELQAQAAAKGVAVAPVASAMAIDEGCFGYEPVGSKGGPHVWARCDSSDPIDLNWEADPQTGAVKSNSAAKALKLSSFKRQYNAIAVKYGHSDKQLKLSMAEKLHLK